LGQISFGQITSEKLIHGKIIVESSSVAGVNIINLVNEKSTVSDNNGDFYILAKAEDLLVFSLVNLEYHRKEIEEKDLNVAVVNIKMTAKVTELQEVIVNKHPEINAVALGISKKGIIQLTPAERRLKVASDFDPELSVSGMTGGSVGIDPILNAISGRTKMLKKELEVEKKERLLTLFDSLYEDKHFFTAKLKIPTEYIKGFQCFCIENQKFVPVLKSKNKTNIEFSLTELAVEYNKIISSEK
jgi:hypothetical protein